MSRRVAILFGVTAVAVVVLFLVDLWTGSVRLSFGQVWDALRGTGAGVADGAGVANGVDGADGAAAYIVRAFRLPKAIVAVLAGAALGASGLQMQTLFRNPLAGPYVLGISSGASLGVALFLMGAPLLAMLPEGVLGVVRNIGMVGAAWVGAALIFLLIAAVSRRIKDIMVILIIGMMLGSVAGAMVEVLQYFSTEGAVKSFVVWTMGSLGGVTMSQLRLLAPVILVALAGTVAVVKPLDAMLLGENYARTMGVNVGLTRTMVFVNTTLLAGTVTAFCGPIGFLGLAVPHIARMLSGEARHRVLVPASMLLGAAVMLGCDILSGVAGRTPLPINTITALVGIPVIILVVVRGRR
jgi:iron complex transport system permease protein